MFGWGLTVYCAYIRAGRSGQTASVRQCREWRPSWTSAFEVRSTKGKSAPVGVFCSSFLARRLLQKRHL